MKRRVLLAGEGKTELGGWAASPPYRDAKATGALEALLRQAAPEGWEIVAAEVWKNLPYFRTTDRKPKEQLNVEALYLLARDNTCDVIVFSRDSDGAAGRVQAVNDGIAELEKLTEGSGWTIVGGLATQCIESWVLALSGVTKSEQLGRGRAQEILASRGIGDTAACVALIEGADLDRVPDDAQSLRDWIRRARSL